MGFRRMGFRRMGFQRMGFRFLSHLSLVMQFAVVSICAMFFAVLCTARSAESSPKAVNPDSIQGEVTLRYDLTPGDHYAYKLITDQVVVNKHSTRLQTSFELIALERDALGNTRCKIKLSSDPEKDSSALHAGTYNKKKFAGYRSWVQEQAYEAVLDALGRILASTVLVADEETGEHLEEATTEPLAKRVTQYNATPEDAPATPELINFILPTSSVLATTTPGAVWIDTFTIASRTQFSAPIGPGQTNKPRLAKDSLFRTTTVDSVKIRNGRQHCYMSLKTERHNASGAKLMALSTLQRDVQTGLVMALHEKAYRLDGDERILHYSATAILIPSLSSPLPPMEPPTVHSR